MDRSFSSPSAEKWHGSASKPVHASVDKLWEIASDYCGLHKWIPMIKRCEAVEGDPRTPGCVRYVEGSSSSWAKEKLLALDGSKRSITYKIMESNMGLEGYIASLTVSKLAAGEGKASIALVEWSFEMNPIGGKSRDNVVGALVSVLSSYIDHLAAAAAAA